MSETATQAAASEAAETASRGEQDVLDQLLRPEVQKSLSELIEQLPKLSEMVGMMTKAYDIAQSVATDRILIDDLKGGLNEIVKPIQEKAKGIAQSVVEANDRAQLDTSTVGLFGVLKMLKDPQVQKTFRFIQAFLDVTAERQNQK